MYVKGSAELRHAQLERVKRLTEPFSPDEYRQATGKMERAAMSQMRRWINWGWMEKIGPGKYARTDQYGESMVRKQIVFNARASNVAQQAGLLPNGKFPDSLGEGKDDAWLAANYRNFPSASKFYKTGWFKAKKSKTAKYWKNQSKKKQEQTGAARAASLANRAVAANGAHVEQKQSEVVACKLKECPECGARFYIAKGGAA